MMMFSCGAGRRKKSSPVLAFNSKGWKWDGLGMVASRQQSHSRVRRTDCNHNPYCVLSRCKREAESH